MIEATITGVQYFSQRDEAAFFRWLKSIPGVLSVVGKGRTLHIRFHKAPSEAALRELWALAQRYHSPVQINISSDARPGTPAEPRKRGRLI